MTKAYLEELRRKFAEVVESHGLADEEVAVVAKALSCEQAIGRPSHDDYPIITGRERIVEARLGTGVGHAFTDHYGHYRGSLRDVLALSLADNYERSVFIATLNATLNHLGLIERTIHCRDDEPAECAREFLTHIRKKFGSPKTAICGLQPRFVETLAGELEVRVTDMDAEQIGTTRTGITIEGPETTDEVLAWAELVLVTGSTIVNGTAGPFTELARSKPVIFYGVTVAGAAYLLNLDRFCALGHEPE